MQVEVLEIKNTVDETNSRLDTTKKRTMQQKKPNEIHREKTVLNLKVSVSCTMASCTYYLSHQIRGKGKTFEEIMAKKKIQTY